MNAIDAVASDLAEHLLESYPPDTFFERSALERLPEPVARLAAARLDDISDSESRLAESAWLDMDHEAVRQVARDYREAARHAARVPAEEWHAFLTDTCAMVVEHMARPATALASFAFRGADGPLSAGFAVARTRAFAPYGYLSEIAARYAERKEVALFDEAALALLLRRIDHRMVGGFGPDEWIALLAPAFDLLGPVGGGKDTLRVGFLEAVFESRNQAHLLDGLDAESDVSRSALLEHLTSALPALEGMDEVSPDAATGPRTVSETEVSDEASDHEVDEPSGSDLENTEEPVDTAAADGESDLLETYSSVLAKPTTTAPVDGPIEGKVDARVAELSVADEAAGAQDGEPAPEPLAAPAADDASEAFKDGSGATDLDGPIESEDAVSAITDTANQQKDPEAALDAWIFPDGAPPAAPDAAAVSDAPGAEVAPPIIGSQYVPPEEEVLDDSEVLGPAREAVSKPEDADADEPLWKRLSRSAEADSRSAATAESSRPAVVDKELGDVPPEALIGEPAQDSESEPLWKRFALGVTGRHSPGAEPTDNGEPLEVLEARVLGLGMRSRREGFVEALFGASGEAYRNSLEKLDACESWTEAAAFINADVFAPRKIHIYSDSAVAFTAAVEARYGRGQPT